jgi:hypothetical protein
MCGKIVSRRDAKAQRRREEEKKRRRADDGNDA